MTEYLIRIKCKSCSWTLPTFPGHVKLPDDLFKNLPNPEIISEVCINLTKEDVSKRGEIWNFYLICAHDCDVTS